MKPLFKSIEIETDTEEETTPLSVAITDKHGNLIVHEISSSGAYRGHNGRLGDWISTGPDVASGIDYVLSELREYMEQVLLE